MSEYAIGVDEAGRGPVIGPLVVCALSIPIDDYATLREMGVKDSKLLSKMRRAKIFEQIKGAVKERNWGLGIVVCEPSMIDYNSIESNLNMLEVELFTEAIRATQSQNKKGTIFLDACDVNSKRFGRNVESLLSHDWSNWRIESEHGMDASDELTGASSIVAKAIRDSAIIELSREIGLDLGSGYPSDPVTKAAVADLISGEVPHDCLRWTWSTVGNAWKSTHGTPVPIRTQRGVISYQSDLRLWMDGNHK